MIDISIKEKTLSYEDTVVLGIPFDRGSSFMSGAALAPPRIMEALTSESTNMWTENGIDIEEKFEWQILESINSLDNRNAFRQIEREIGKSIDQKVKVISLGGDHSITYPITRAYAKQYRNLTEALQLLQRYY